MHPVAALASDYPTVAAALVVIVGFALGIVAIVARWAMLRRLASKRLGYRICRIAKGRYVYEESVPGLGFKQPAFWPEVLAYLGIGRSKPSDSNRQLPFQCTKSGVHYNLHFHPSEQWNSLVPDWARGRRAEIVERIHGSFAEAFGDKNVSESALDAESRLAED